MSAIKPSVKIEEFERPEQQYSSEYGSNGGTVINIVTKSARISTTVPAVLHAPPRNSTPTTSSPMPPATPRALTGTTRARIHRRSDHSSEDFFLLRL